MRKNHVSVRLDADTLARVEALIPLVQVEGRTATRSDVVRALVLRGLDLQEAAPPAGRHEERDS
jgi:Arc/MetJ-type ribon-helix-helix transcriptional regulator